MGEKKYKDIELRSEEVQEVMNHISPWVVRWGLTVLFLILMAVLVGCWIFKYPDTLVAEVTLATEEPPASVLAHAAGKLDTLYVKNGSLVGEGTNLGVINNAAVLEDVRWLSEQMQEWERTNYAWKKGMEIFADKRLQLGELQSAFAIFITALSEYTLFMKQDYYTKKLWVQEKQLKGQRTYLHVAEQEYELIKKDVNLAQNMYSRDSTLYARNAMIVTEFEESGSKYLQSLRLEESARMNLLQAEMQLVQHEENLIDIRKQAYDEEQTHHTKLKNSVEQLASQLSA